MAEEGAADLMVDLIMKETNNKIFQETVELGIALLEGGNNVIQVSFTKDIKFTGCSYGFHFLTNTHTLKQLQKDHKGCD